VTATATFQAGEGVKSMHLQVVGQVPGADEAAFRQAAETAKENCPISKALAALPEITLEAKLE
jgi:osmotically inducible protein OsmC